MSAVPKPNYTVQEYLIRERAASSKSEYYRGQIFAMAGGSPRHNTIGGNVSVVNYRSMSMIMMRSLIRP